VGSLRHMATESPSPSAHADATGRVVREHAAGVVPLGQRPQPLAARVEAGTRRESIRMELLLARARARTPRGPRSA
jgi:hypothetical protein